MFAHIHPGDSSAASLRQSGVPGSVYVWSDVLHEGPLSAAWSDEDRRRERAAALFPLCGGAVTHGRLEARLASQDEGLDRALRADETVLWFDACLYDQMILAYLLAELGSRPSAATLALIGIDAFEGVPAFKGLGQISPHQLGSLLSRRLPVSSDQFDLARAAWQAVAGEDPRAVLELAGRDLSPLPYLQEALLRLLEHYPSPADGLNRSERAMLDALAGEPRSPVEVFNALSAAEARPFFGDTLCYAWLRRLAEQPRPLVAMEGPGPLPLWDPPPGVGTQWRCSLTPEGAEVQRGRRHASSLNPADRWVGGVHVTPANDWAFDPGVRELRRGRA